ncbi:MAG: hypothetical protein J6S14_15330 [Clostridia bacterium]|nr:hypothetical protein [Clostridia bacterium]
MFDTSHYHAGNHTTNFQINAVTGAILKNHPKSWFERFHLKSKRAEELLVEGGHHATKPAYDKDWRDRVVEAPDKNITVLQMVICGDMEVLAELVYTKDYEISVMPEAIANVQ